MSFQVTPEVSSLIDRARKSALQGDNVAAMNNFTIAGGIVYKLAMAHRGEDRAIGLIQAAQLHYRASDYPKAYGYLSQIDSIALTNKWENIFSHYLRVCSTRSRSNWKTERAKLLYKLHIKKKWRKLLKLLADCPYVISEVEVAKIRAEACKELGKISAAKQFDLDVKRLSEASKNPPLNIYF